MSEDDSHINDQQPEAEPSIFESVSEPMVTEVEAPPVEPEIEPTPVEPELLEGEPSEPLPEVEPPPPSKFNLFLKRALRWVTGFMLVFVLGIVAMWVVRVRPDQAELKSLRAELEVMGDQITTLEDQVQSLLPLEEENEYLQEELHKTEQQMTILRVLVDVTEAQLAVAQEDPVAAKAALEVTDERLRKLDVEFVGADILKELREKLALVLVELDSDAFAAKDHLQALAYRLSTTLEDSLLDE